MPDRGGYVLIMNEDVNEDDERRDVERDQDDAEREVKGRREKAEHPEDLEDPRGGRKPPEPFSGATR
jgi:hypothetical protein